MANRRKFLQGAAVLSSAPLAGRAFSSGHSAPAAVIPALDAIVFDRRHQAARDFAAIAAHLDVPRHAFEADITELWKHELLRLWKSAPGQLAGLTERPALFLLERLAWDHGLRVVFEAEHELRADGRVQHQVLRSADARLGAELEGAGEGWPGVLAEALVRGRQAAARDFRPSGAAMAAHLGEPAKLYSWIIAPRSAVQG